MIDLLKLSTEDLQLLVQYREIIEKNINFPKNFWTAEKNQVKGVKLKCCLLTRFCFENLARLEVKDLPKYNLKQLKEILIKYRLFGMVQIVFKHDVLEIIKNTYPEDFFTQKLYEWKWSKHGIWEDDAMVIQAVKNMVHSEGIRNLKDIPSFDWKKRLLKHGIYNVLHRFNWSIFKMFDFVYPKTFHPADFKYKTKWKDSDSLSNAYYYMDKSFQTANYTIEDIKLLTTSDFRRLGLAAMLITVFNSSTLRAKEYYLYKTAGNSTNLKELSASIKSIRQKKFDEKVYRRLKKVAVNKSIYSLHENYTLYNFIKRHAKNNNMSIKDYISKYGFTYENARPDPIIIDQDQLWDLRKQGYTYVQIADILNTNPTKISELCKEHFGGDPLIPRPLDSYITPQELMDKYRVDHKTVMKLVSENNYENHMTIRFRYLKKSEIIPAIESYVSTNKSHRHLVRRYS